MAWSARISGLPPAELVGLTATPEKFTYGYFAGNLVANYTHEQSVIDGVNVDYTVYRIETNITSGGSSVEKGEWVQVRDRFTREQAFRELDDELTYDPEKLDRTVIATDQIRTVVRTFRDKVRSEIFPGRKEETDGTYGYSGEGQGYDQKMTRGNKAIRDHAANGKRLRLFRGARGEVEYLGEYEYVTHRTVLVPAGSGYPAHNVILFTLRPLNGAS